MSSITTGIIEINLFGEIEFINMRLMSVILKDENNLLIDLI